MRRYLACLPLFFAPASSYLSCAYPLRIIRSRCIVENGDIMLIDTSEPKVRGNGIYIFLVDGLLLVKHLRVRIDGALELTGMGEEALHPEVISRDDLDRVTIIGRAIWRASRT